MHVGVGVVLVTVGTGVLMRAVRFLRGAHQSRAKIIGRAPTWTLCGLAGCQLVVAGLLLALSVRTG